MFYSIFQFTKKKDPSSGSDSECGGGSDASDGSSLPVIKNPTSRKTLFKGKGKGVGKSSDRTQSKGDRQMDLVEKVSRVNWRKGYVKSGSINT